MLLVGLGETSETVAQYGACQGTYNQELHVQVLKCALHGEAVAAQSVYVHATRPCIASLSCSSSGGIAPAIHCTASSLLYDRNWCRLAQAVLAREEPEETFLKTVPQQLASLHIIHPVRVKSSYTHQNAQCATRRLHGASTCCATS